MKRTFRGRCHFEIDGIPVSTPEQYHSLLQTYTPRDSLYFTLLRGVQQLTKTVVLQSLPAGYELSYTRRVFGFELHQQESGVYIDKIVDGAAADKVGLQRGDQIVKIDDIRVETLTEFKHAIEYRLGRRQLDFTVIRDNVGYLVKLP